VKHGNSILSILVKYGSTGNPRYTPTHLRYLPAPDPSRKGILHKNIIKAFINGFFVKYRVCFVNCTGGLKLQKTLKDLKTNLMSPIPLVGWIIATLICVAIGPFGTYQGDTLGFRFLFWGGIIFSGIVYALLCLHAAHNIWPKRSFLQVAPISGTFSTITISISLKILVLKIYTDPQPSLLMITLIVGSIIVAVTILMHLLGPAQIEQAKTLNLAGQSDNPFLSRISTDMGTKLIRLTMRDHYVEVHTCQGMQLIHERFSNAVAALSEFNGYQVHRSHWVNLDEVCGVIKSGGKLAFKMTDGFNVPISRGKIAELKQLGLLG
jgi:hypothetical protein